MKNTVKKIWGKPAIKSNLSISKTLSGFATGTKDGGAVMFQLRS